MNGLLEADSLKQRVHFKVEAWDAGMCDRTTGLVLPHARKIYKPKLVAEGEHNLLMYGGASCQWQTLLGNGTATAGQALTYFNNANAAIGVGDSATAAAATQTNLQGAASPTNRIRKAMNATYPLHTDGVVSGAASAVFQSTFGTTEANFTWNEWGLFNSATDGTGRMLNRRVVNLVTKTSAVALDFTITLTLA
jgi:hypothetical protein